MLERHLRRIPVLSLALLCLLASSRDSQAVTIAISGRTSAIDTIEPGIHVTARLLGGEKPHTYDLPCLGPWPFVDCFHAEVFGDWRTYQRVEKIVFRLAKQAAQDGEPIVLLGYSHGATAALRVVRKLERQKVPLNNLVLVTLDYVDLGYPPELIGGSRTVPDGVAAALNFYQTGKRPKGAKLKGHQVTNKKLTETIMRELELASELDPHDPRFQKTAHGYVQHSLAVRRAVLERFGVTRYLPGVWTADLDGTLTLPNSEREVVAGSIGDFILDYRDKKGRSWVAWRWVEDGKRYQRITGAIKRNRIEGNFTLVPEVRVRGCSAEDLDDTTGSFTGTTDFCASTMTIAGSTPLFDPDGCATKEMGILDGRIDWSLLVGGCAEGRDDVDFDMVGRWAATEIEGAVDADGNPLAVDGSVSTWTFHRNGTYNWFLHAPPHFDLGGAGTYSLERNRLTVTGIVASTLFSETSGPTDVISLTFGDGTFSFRDEGGDRWSYAREE